MVWYLCKRVNYEDTKYQFGGVVLSESFFFLKKKLTENIMQIQSYNNETLNDYIYFLRAIMQVGPDGSASMAWDYAGLWCNLHSLALERPVAVFLSTVFLRRFVNIFNQSLFRSRLWSFSTARHCYMLQLYRNILNCLKSNV